MTTAEAKAKLIEFGRVEFNGYAIWETKSGTEYSGRYRLAPVGNRDEWFSYTPGERSCSLEEAIAAVEARS